mgnify:CR=1 FL=1
MRRLIVILLLFGMGIVGVPLLGAVSGIPIAATAWLLAIFFLPAIVGLALSAGRHLLAVEPADLASEVARRADASLRAYGDAADRGPAEEPTSTHE